APPRTSFTRFAKLWRHRRVSCTGGGLCRVCFYPGDRYPNGVREPLKIQGSPKCKARKKFRRAAYVLYVSKKFFPQRSITSHLVAVFWRLSGMAITNALPSVFCWVSQMASSHISSSISWDEM